MELEGCRVCELFGGPHGEHAGWNGSRIARDPASTATWAEQVAARRLEREYQTGRIAPEGKSSATPESDDLVEPVSGEVLDAAWDPTGTNAVFEEELLPHLRKPWARDASPPPVAPGWIYAPQAERGAVPDLEPTGDEVDRLLEDALAMAYEGQTVRLTVLDRGTGEEATFSVVKRSDVDDRTERLDRIRTLERRIRDNLEGMGS